MFLCANRGLKTVWMIGEQLGHQSCQLLTMVVGQTDVILLIDGLQLSVESANHHVLKAFALNLCPVLNLVAGNVFHITSYIETGIGIGTLSTNSRHQLVVLIGNEVLGSQL